jgi:hypothetical protein
MESLEHESEVHHVMVKLLLKQERFMSYILMPILHKKENIFNSTDSIQQKIESLVSESKI